MSYTKNNKVQDPLAMSEWVNVVVLPEAFSERKMSVRHPAKPRKKARKHGKKRSKFANNTGSYEWYTPSKYIEAARRTMGSIDTDPASCDMAQKIVRAAVYYTKETGGLTRMWKGNIWLNPPYATKIIGKFIGTLVEKRISGETKQAIVLTNNTTEAKFFQILFSSCNALCFVKGRIKFYAPVETRSGGPQQGQVIFYFGTKCDAFTREFKEFGPVLTKGGALYYE